MAPKPTSFLIQRLEGDRAATVATATIRAQLEQQGTPIGPMDVLIVGTAVSLQATLVTHDVKKFSRVSGLAIVDWY